MSSTATLISPAASGMTRAAAPAVGARAARGAAWTVIFSLLGKMVTLATQFVLAWLLVPEELGLVALTLGVMSFTAIVGGANLKSILVQRAERFAAEAGPTFWLVLLLNLATAGLLVAVAPLVAAVFGQSRVTALLLVAALAIPIQSLSTVYAAALHRDLRFRRIGAIQFGAGLVQNGLAVLLAWLGWGAYAMILPLVVSAILLAAAFRAAAGRIDPGRLDWRRTIEQARPAGWLIVNGLFVALLGSGASLAIGLCRHPAAVAGYYYWGASISSQAVFLLAVNLQGVLFPVLTHLNASPARQCAGALRANQAMLGVIGPVCILQALLAGPIIGHCFHERWLPAVPVVQWLSVGLMTQPFSLLATSLLLAHGRFAALAALNAGIALAVFGAATVGASIGNHVTVAALAAPTLGLANLVAGAWAFRAVGASGSRVVSTALPPLGLTLAMALAGAWIQQATRTLNPFLGAGAVVAGSGLVAGLGAWLLMPGLLGELRRHLRRPRASAVAAADGGPLAEEGHP